MYQRWRKLGRIFQPSQSAGWLHSHAAVPISEHLYDDIFRVYFSSRDADNRSYTGEFILDINHPSRMISRPSKPVLSPGALGQFDDSGAMGSWLVKHGERHYLYYIGWNLGITVPFRNSIGVAIFRNGEFRQAKGPIIDRTLSEPHFTASCCVIPDGDLWRMWYLSCTGWQEGPDGPVHNYHIKYAESKDGLCWVRNGDVAIDYKDENEYAISRPSVLRDGNTWKMWFSSRGGSYRIRYAESTDGKTWKRLDHLCQIDVSESGWDSEMIEYPYVFDHKGKRYMLYNGNGYGKSGIGLAVLEHTSTP